jgi:hypothetical protein
MGQNRCTDPELPSKPRVQALIARPASTAILEGQIISIEDHVCLSPDDFTRREVWIKDVLRACGGY